MPDLVPKLGLLAWIRIQRHDATEERQPLVDLVATHRHFGCPTSPAHSRSPEPLHLKLLAGPCQVLVLRSNRLEIVVRGTGELISSLGSRFEPSCEARMHSRSPGLGQAAIATSRVSACLMTYSRSPPSVEPRTTSDEVPLLRSPMLGLSPAISS